MLNPEEKGNTDQTSKIKTLDLIAHLVTNFVPKMLSFRFVLKHLIKKLQMWDLNEFFRCNLWIIRVLHQHQSNLLWVKLQINYANLAQNISHSPICHY